MSLTRALSTRSSRGTLPLAPNSAGFTHHPGPRVSTAGAFHRGLGRGLGVNRRAPPRGRPRSAAFSGKYEVLDNVELPPEEAAQALRALTMFFTLPSLWRRASIRRCT